MKKLLLSLFNRQIPIRPLEKISEVVSRFSFFERLVFFTLTLILAVSSVTLLFFINSAFLVEIPAEGGVLREGMIEPPKFINPLLAFSDTDRDMTSLIFSGLLKETPQGELIPDLAENFSISDDELTYTFVLRNNLSFHDGAKLTAEDILFTIQKAQDPTLKSLRRASWEGVQVEKVDDRTIKFILSKPYAPFLRNTTIGILPKHLWKDTQPEHFTFNPLNNNPVGSGPFKISKLTKNKLTGAPESYLLVPFKGYALGAPFISIETSFFNNEKELLDGIAGGTIDSANSITPKNVAFLRINGKIDNKKVSSTPLPRTFAVFFNQNQNKALSFKEVRQALNVLVDRNKIISEVLEGFGTTLDTVIPRTKLTPGSDILITNTPQKDRIAEAKKILESNGWVWSSTANRYEKKIKKEVIPLTLSLSTSEASELKAVAELLQANWASAGISVEIKVFEAGDLTTNVIGPRKYDALLYGEVIDQNLDLYPFWHSSQRKDPGLNIALYTNSIADKLLEEGRETTNLEMRLQKYAAFSKEIEKDIPAIFLYTPNFIYITPMKLQGLSLGETLVPSDRFLSVTRWYLQTDRVWKIFAGYR